MAESGGKYPQIEHLDHLGELVTVFIRSLHRMQNAGPIYLTVNNNYYGYVESVVSDNSQSPSNHNSTITVSNSVPAPINVTQGKVHMGDMFQGISNSTIVSRSKVERAFNRLQDNGEGESANLLAEIGKHVSDANNAAAGAVYSQMAEELSKPAHDKGVLKSCWDGLVAILPSLASLSAEAIKAFAI